MPTIQIDVYPAGKSTYTPYEYYKNISQDTKVDPRLIPSKYISSNMIPRIRGWLIDSPLATYPKIPLVYISSSLKQGWRYVQHYNNRVILASTVPISKVCIWYSKLAKCNTLKWSLIDTDGHIVPMYYHTTYTYSSL